MTCGVYKISCWCSEVRELLNSDISDAEKIQKVKAGLKSNNISIQDGEYTVSLEATSNGLEVSLPP